jgi:hypothetical protein
MSRAQKLTLRDALTTAEGATITEITIRPPKARDIDAITTADDDSSMQASFGLLASVTGLSVDQVADLSVDDFFDAFSIATGFFPQDVRPTLPRSATS